MWHDLTSAELDGHIAQQARIVRDNELQPLSG
jgi:hypothetical protein